MTAPLARIRPALDLPTPVERPREADEDALPSAVCALSVPPARPVAWSVRDFLLAGELAIIAGIGGAWKTVIALCIAAAKAGGYNAFSHPRFTTLRGSV